MKTATTEPSPVHTATVERRPFLRLEPEPRAALTDDVRSGLVLAEQFLTDQVPALVQGLVNYAIGVQSRRRPAGRRIAPSVAAINRRRRASRQWIQAILAGAIDRETLQTIGHTLIPQLAGSGPEVHRGAALGRQCVEYLRGALTAGIFGEPVANLVPEARALHGIETVLAIHLDSYENAVAASRDVANA